MADAAMKLGHIHQHAIGVAEDHNTAAHWYGKAAEVFLKKGDVSSATAATASLAAVAPQHPLVEKMRALLADCAPCSVAQVSSSVKMRR